MKKHTITNPFLIHILFYIFTMLCCVTLGFAQEEENKTEKKASLFAKGEIKKIAYDITKFKVDDNNSTLKEVLDITSLNESMFVVAYRYLNYRVGLMSFKFDYSTEKINSLKETFYNSGNSQKANITNIKIIKLNSSRFCVINNEVGGKHTYLTVYDVNNSTGAFTEKSEVVIGNSDSLDATILKHENGGSSYFITSSYDQNNSKRTKHIIWKVSNSGKIYRRGEYTIKSSSKIAIERLSDSKFVTATQNTSNNRENLLLRYWNIDNIDGVFTPELLDSHESRVLGEVKDSPRGISITRLNNEKFAVVIAPLHQGQITLTYTICDNETLCRSNYTKNNNVKANDIDITSLGLHNSDVFVTSARDSKEGKVYLRASHADERATIKKIDHHFHYAANMVRLDKLTSPYFTTAHSRLKDKKLIVNVWKVKNLSLFSSPENFENLEVQQSSAETD